MLILLAPSETKTPPPDRGKPLALDTLSFPELTETRRRVLEATIETSGRPDALARLQIGRSLGDEVAWNTRLRAMPTRPALQTYTGVVFSAIDPASLSPRAKRRAGRSLVILSGLWGALRAGDRIPPYRLNICSDLVGLGSLEPMWRRHIPGVLGDAAGSRGLVIDGRSSSYRSMGDAEGVTERTVVVRVVRPGARRAAPSFVAKRTRGLLVRHILEAPATATTLEDLVDLVGERWQVELVPPARPGKPSTLQITPEDRG